MTKLIIMRGVPGSGKSTVARERQKNASTPTIIVSRDDLRMAYFVSEVPGREAEEFITKIEFEAIRKGLAAGYDVISDNTHIEARYVNDKIKLAYETDAEVEIVEVVESLAVCLERNSNRFVEGGRYVPEAIIEKMFSRYKPFKYTPLPTFEKYVPDISLKDCILVDIDGTIATKGDRGYFDWEKVGVDYPVNNLLSLLDALQSDSALDVIIFSGRDGVCRPETEAWLRKHHVHYHSLYMRAEGDMRADTIVKMEMFDAYIRNEYNCLGVFDDRPSVVRQWMKHDIPVFHVAPFGEDF